MALSWNLFDGGNMIAQVREKRALLDSARANVKVTELKERQLPKLDDEFAKDVGEFATLAALREDTKKKLEKQLNDSAEQTLVTNLVASLVNATNRPSLLIEGLYDWKLAGRPSGVMLIRSSEPV